MKTSLRIAFIIMLLLSAFTLTYSDERLFPIWAWSQALGGVRAVGDWGALSASANPALLSEMPEKTFGLSGGSVYSGLFNATAFGATFSAAGLSFGATVSYMGGSIKKTDLTNPLKPLSADNPPVVVGEEHHYALWTDIGGAKKIFEDVSFGASVTFVAKHVPENLSGWGFLGSIGARWDLSTNISIAALVKDITTYNIFWNDGLHEFHSPSLWLGGKFKKTLKKDITATLFVEDHFNYEYGIQYPGVGVELRFPTLTALAGGFDGRTFSLGVAQKVKGFELIGCASQTRNLGATISFALGYGFK